MGDWPPGRDKAQREFGRRLRAARKAEGLTQEGLAERAFVHRTFVGQIERGDSNPTLWSVLRLAAAARVKAATLIDGLEPPLD